MPRIVSVSNELSDDMVVRQEHGGQSTHVRIVRPERPALNDRP